MPPVPGQYFNDYANVVPPAVADQLNRQLEQFERDTSNQIVVAVYPKMQSDSDIADYTFRVKETWHVGQKGKNNGAVLFVFIQDHKLFIQVNYGLEGALPDATCKEIIDQEITPRFKAGDYAGGLTAGVNAILAATKGEYHGNGSTVANGSGNNPGSNIALFIGIIIFLVIFVVVGVFNKGRGLPFIVYAGSSILGSGRSLGGGGGFSGGDFMGGGGFGGGGGAGGSW